MHKKPPPQFKEPGVVSGEWLFWMHTTKGIPPMIMELQMGGMRFDMDRYHELMEEHRVISRA